MLRGSMFRKYKLYLRIEEEPTEEAAIDNDVFLIDDDNLKLKNEAGKSEPA